MHTIFPESLYKPGERHMLYDRYNKAYPRMMKLTRDWGRYFRRMTEWTDKKGEAFNPLEHLIGKLTQYGPAAEQHRNNMFELTLYDPARDQNMFRNRQCLSFIEIKPEQTNDGGRLHMTALYRSHSYVAKSLGNFIGLGRLLNFIALESGTKPGSLTIISTYAELDPGALNAKRNTTPWGMTAARALIKSCAGIKPADESPTLTTAFTDAGV